MVSREVASDGVPIGGGDRSVGCDDHARHAGDVANAAGSRSSTKKGLKFCAAAKPADHAGRAAGNQRRGMECKGPTETTIWSTVAKVDAQ